jgi:hypothetical protein
MDEQLHSSLRAQSGEPIWKGEPRIVSKKKAKRDEDAHQRKVYAAVDKRDGLRCRLTGRRANPHSIEALGRLHHHHILQRGRDCGVTETWNIVSVDPIVHALIGLNKITVEGNADVDLLWVVRSDAVVEAFGHSRVPQYVRVVAVENWAAWLQEHACRVQRFTPPTLTFGDTGE